MSRKLRESEAITSQRSRTGIKNDTMTKAKEPNVKLQSTQPI